MNKRHNEREKLHLQLDHLNDTQVKEVLSFIHTLETKSSDRSPQEARSTEIDELTSTLIAARENRRARQVFEWESARRRAEARAATQRHAQR